MTINAWGSSNPIEESKGGTNQSTYAAGDILYSDATNSLEKLTKGSDSEVLTLASGLPSWATAGGGGSGLVLLSTATASASSTLDFASSIDSTYNLYVFVMDRLEGSAASTIQIRTSSDGGSSYDSGSSDYTFSGVVQQANSSTMDILYAGAVPFYLEVNIYLHSPSETTQTTLNWRGGRELSSGNASFIDPGFGLRKEFAIVDAVRFLPSSGTFTSGTIKMYGMTTPS